MKLLVVAATHAELYQVFEHFNLPNLAFVQNAKFDVLITGVGMTATAFALGKYLNNTYNLVLNAGIAGSFDRNIALGTVVNIYSDTFAEFGAEDHENFIAIDELGFGKSTYNASHTLTALPQVKGITVNKVHGNANSIASLTKRLSVQTESMEGAAVFYACEKNDINVAQVRSISNYVEPRAKENWEIGLAIKNLNTWLIDFIHAQM